MDFNSDRRLDMPALGLSLGLWEGTFRGFDRLWLRWFTLEGELIQAPDEEVVEAKQKTAEAEQKAQLAKQKATEAEQKAAEAEQKAQLAKQEAAEEKIKAAKLAEQLRQLGINPDDIK